MLMKRFEEYVKQIKLKQSDDISVEVEDEKNVDVIRRLIYYDVKTLCL
jgi:antitoxin component of MazEF toxin-antitoxin module